MKKLFALILALIMCISLVACGGDKKDDDVAQSGNENTPGSSTPVTQKPIEAPDPTVTYKDTVRISVPSERTVTGYYGSTNQPASYYARMTMETLFQKNYETDEVDGIVAKEAVDVNGDGKTWKVTIRDDVVFHNQGEYYADLKASDVAFTFEFTKTDGAGQQAGSVTRTISLNNYIDSIDVNGDYELTFNLNTALFDFPSWTFNAYLLSEKAVEEFGPVDGQDIFSGPYYINKSESILGQYHTMTRFDDYYGGIDNYPTKNIIFMLHTDQNTGAAALQAGEVDALVCDDATIALQFQSSSDFIVHENTGTINWFVGCNSYDGKGFFDGEDTEEKIKLRQAICHGLDRDKIVSVIYAANPSAGARVDNIFGKSTYGYVDQGEWAYDLEKARGLMNELGYNENNHLKLVLAHISTSTTYAQIVQDQLKAIYIDCELKTIERSQYGSFLRTGEGWDLFVNYYSTATTMAGTMSSHMHSTGSGAKTQGWSSAAMDEKIDYVMGQPTADAQLEAFADFQAWAHDYHARIPTHAGKVMIEAKAEVEGISVCPDVAFQNYGTFRIPE